MDFVSFKFLGIKVKEIIEELDNPENLSREMRVSSVDKISKFVMMAFENTAKIGQSWNPIHGKAIIMVVRQITSHKTTNAGCV